MHLFAMISDRHRDKPKAKTTAADTAAVFHAPKRDADLSPSKSTSAVRTTPPRRALEAPDD